MNIGKFLDLITKQKVWFTRAIEFRKTDPYEGALTMSDQQKLDRVLAAKDKNELRSLSPTIDVYIDAWPEMSLYYFQLIFLTRIPWVEMNAYTTALSCWHENPSESDAMWALYAQRDAGIAIKSNVERVLNAFASSERELTIGKVNYGSQASLSAIADYNNYDSLLIKRHAFHHENEVRIIVRTLDGYEASGWSRKNRRYRLDFSRTVPRGIYINCNLYSLIEEVIISPLTPSYTVESLESVARVIIPSVPIRRSTLLTKEDDLRPDRFSPQLKLLWDHYGRTRRVLDLDELSLSEEELTARRWQREARLDAVTEG
jgi:hypothetical protein